MTTAILMELPEWEAKTEEIVLRVLARNQPKILLTAQEVCAMARISKVTLWKYIDQKLIIPEPRAHMRCKLFFTQQEVSRFTGTKYRYQHAAK